LKSSFFALAILFDTRGRPDGSAASVNYGEIGRIKLVCNAHNSAMRVRTNPRIRDWTHVQR
jgi:hypothetical protein